jgi:hypothetical protein
MALETSPASEADTSTKRKSKPSTRLADENNCAVHGTSHQNLRKEVIEVAEAKKRKAAGAHWSWRSGHAPNLFIETASKEDPALKKTKPSQPPSNRQDMDNPEKSRIVKDAENGRGKGTKKIETTVPTSS